MVKIELTQKGSVSTLYANEGETLSKVLMEKGISHSHPCGGKGQCKKCTVMVNGIPELSCKYSIFSDITVILEGQAEMTLEAPLGSKSIKKGAICLDIGTTTLAAALVSADSGEIISTVSAKNPQSVFGCDVISRIEYCSNNGPKPLQRPLISRINEMIDTLTRGCQFSEGLSLFVSGNTTMLHLFCGTDCTSMGTYPYTPAFLEGKDMPAPVLGIERALRVITLPCISAFVGADVVAGLNSLPLPKDGKYSLLVDLGTNAEVVLFSGKGFICTAAAAGPCFEGANISCGMSAERGAIYSYSSKDRYSVIGNTKPRGICATGLIDVICALLKDGSIDETGALSCDSIEIAQGVFFTGEDVRQFQLAKSAVYSAIACLMKIEGIDFSDIENLFITGGFAAKMDIKNAVFSGLLPQELESVAVPVSNSCLSGTVKFALSGNRVSSLLENARYVDLSGNEDFCDLFMENMYFNEY